MDCKLGLHADLLEVLELILQADCIFEFDIGGIDADYFASVTAEGKVFTSKIKFCIALGSVHLKVCCEVICSESSGNKSFSTSSKYLFYIRKTASGLNLRDDL